MTASQQWKVLGARLLVRPIDPDQGAQLVKARQDDSSGMSEGQECEIVAIGGTKNVGTSIGASNSVVPMDIWTLAEELGIPNMGTPPGWARTVVQRLQAQRMMGITLDSPLLLSTFCVGQRVVVARYKGAKVELNGEELLVVDVDTDVLLVQTEKEVDQSAQ